MAKLTNLLQERGNITEQEEEAKSVTAMNVSNSEGDSTKIGQNRQEVVVRNVRTFKHVENADNETKGREVTNEVQLTWIYETHMSTYVQNISIDIKKQTNKGGNTWDSDHKKGKRHNEPNLNTNASDVNFDLDTSDKIWDLYEQ